MKKRILAVALCFVMVSAFAVTGAASAAGKSSIRQFDITSTTENAVVGKLTLDTATGHVVMNVNFAKAGGNPDTKAYWKDFFRDPNTPRNVYVDVWNQNTGQLLHLGVFSVTNKGGNVHGEGTVSDKAVLPTIAGWSTSDVTGAYFGPA